MITSLRGLGHRGVRLLDGIAVFWVVLWLVLAAATGYQIWQLTRLTDTAEVSSVAIDRAGRALQNLSEIPLVGDEPGQVGDEVRLAAEELQRSADASRGDVRRLSLLLGLSVFLIPVSPILGLYLPLRLSHRREVAAIRRSLDGGRRTPALDGYLAARAVHNLSFAELRQISADPVRDLELGRHAALAEAELGRLGLPAKTRP